MITPDHCWAEWNGHFVQDGKPMPCGKRAIFADNIVQGSTVTTYPESAVGNWQRRVHLAKTGFRWHKHGHNWWMTTRIDFWVDPPWDPYEWQGRLITGGINTTFRLRRVRSRDIFRRIDGKLPKPVAITPVQVGELTLWHATFADRPDIYAGRPRGDNNGLYGWVLAPNPEEVIRAMTLQRLKLVA